MTRPTCKQASEPTAIPLQPPVQPASFPSRLIGSAAIRGTGNDGANSITGNSAANVLNGGAGLDHLDGREGSDLYIINSAVDHAAAEINDTGSSGIDELRFASRSAGQTLSVFEVDAGLERVTIGTGSGARAISTATTALNINAAQAPNGLAVRGNNGANTLIGSAFSDILTGNSGADIFRFQTPLNAATNVDRITDFTPTASLSSSDLIQLENTGSGRFTAITATGTLAPAAFCVGSAFTSSDQRIRYNATSGNLFYDPDGSGAAASILFANLPSNLSLSNLQFAVI